MHVIGFAAFSRAWGRVLFRGRHPGAVSCRRPTPSTPAPPAAPGVLSPIAVQSRPVPIPTDGEAAPPSPCGSLLRATGPGKAPLRLAVIGPGECRAGRAERGLLPGQRPQRRSGARAVVLRRSGRRSGRGGSRCRLRRRGRRRRCGRGPGPACRPSAIPPGRRRSGGAAYPARGRSADAGLRPRRRAGPPAAQAECDPDMSAAKRR